MLNRLLKGCVFNGLGEDLVSLRQVHQDRTHRERIVIWNRQDPKEGSVSCNIYKGFKNPGQASPEVQSVERLSAWSHSGTPPIPAHRYVEENGSAAMLAAKRSADVTPEVMSGNM